MYREIGTDCFPNFFNLWVILVVISKGRKSLSHFGGRSEKGSSWRKWQPGISKTHHEKWKVLWISILHLLMDLYIDCTNVFLLKWKMLEIFFAPVNFVQPSTINKIQKSNKDLKVISKGSRYHLIPSFPSHFFNPPIHPYCNQVGVLGKPW